MKKSLERYGKIGFIFTGIMGVLLHFLYDLTGESILVATFSAVNESIWEHMKILFFPLLVFAFIEYRLIGKNFKNFWCVKLIGTAGGVLTIPFLYYTYKGALGVSADWFNIAIFFIAVAVTFIPETTMLKRDVPCYLPPVTSLSILILIAILFVIFTFIPPEIPLFMNPIEGGYGI